MKNRTIIPLTPHTGGVLDPSQIIGREKIIQEYWNILQRQGIVLYAERRFGKSAILTKMNAEDKNSYLTIYKGVEGIRNPDEFIDSFFTHIKEKKLINESGLKKAEGLINSFISYVPEIKGIKLKNPVKKWQKQLNYLLTLLTEQHNDKYIVVMLDEFTIMLDKMEELEAVNILGLLRDLVQHKFSEKLRFVYCGSIGVDLVLDKLKRAGHNIGDPINHMNKQRLLPFSDEETLFFGQCLNMGCGLNLSEGVIKHINNIADNVPYFIDKMFARIQYNTKVDISVINRVLMDILKDPSNSDNLSHFYDRIDHYYPNKTLTNHILNFLSKRNDYTSEDEIANHINQSMEAERTSINDETDRLWKDGYLKRESIKGKRHFQFNYSIIQKWWKINKAT